MEGIYVYDLKAGDVVEVTAENRVYTLKILGPKNCSVELSSNYGAFVKPANYCLMGSFVVDGGYLTVEAGWIGVGFRLVFSPPLVLSYTQKILVNGKTVFPKE